jgi:cell division protein FtsL
MPDHATATRPRTAPLQPRRISGPVRRPVPVGPPARGRTGAFERLARFPDHRLVDRMLRSRACIWLIGLMLGGIVAMQVSLLKLNTGISRAVATQTTLERDNATLQAQIAELSAGDRIRTAAQKENMIDPPAGNTRFLRARESDVPRAARRIRPPSERARLVMAYHGILPEALSAPGTLAGVTATTAASLPTPTATAAPALPTPAPSAASALPTPAPSAASSLPTPAPTAAAASSLPTPAPTAAPAVPRATPPLPTPAPTLAPQG